MKKLIFAVAILAGGFSTYATTTNNINPVDVVCSVVNEGFEEISIEKLPTAVVEAVSKDFPDATLSKAFVNEKEQYKLELTVEQETKTVYANKEGNWLEEKEVDSAQK